MVLSKVVRNPNTEDEMDGLDGGATAACRIDATEKKLAGAVMNSFMKRCETDAHKSCDAAAEKNLAGAAKDEFHKEMRYGWSRKLS